MYADVLLRLFAVTQQRYQPLSREAALYVIGDVLMDPAAVALTLDADDALSNSADEGGDAGTCASRRALHHALSGYGAT
ncbi:MAG: hypothetical protein NVSMB42_12470 [Herpetosiphon sp.]